MLLWLKRISQDDPDDGSQFQASTWSDQTFLSTINRNKEYSHPLKYLALKFQCRSLTTSVEVNVSTFMIPSQQKEILQPLPPLPTMLWVPEKKSMNKFQLVDSTSEGLLIHQLKYWNKYTWFTVLISFCLIVIRRQIIWRKKRNDSSHLSR